MSVPDLPGRFQRAPSSDAELRALLRLDIEEERRSPSGTRVVARLIGRALATVGLIVSLALLYASYWFHLNMEDLAFPFVIGSLCGGLGLGMPCAFYLATGKITAPPRFF